MIIRLSMVKLNCCVLSQCLQNIIIWYWARKFCLRKFTKIKVWRRKNEAVWYSNTDPEMPASAKKRWFIRRKNAKTNYCPFMCSYLEESGKCATSGAASDFYFRWGVGWAVPFSWPECKTNNNYSKGKKIIFHCDQNWRYCLENLIQFRATAHATFGVISKLKLI